MKELIKTKIDADFDQILTICEFADEFRDIDTSKWIKMITRSIHSLEFTKRINYVGYYDEKGVSIKSFAQIKDFEYLPIDL